MVDSVFFIGLAIIAITQEIKLVFPKVSGVFTIPVAVLVGVAVALADKYIGISDINIATGVVTALSAVGVHTLVTKPSVPRA